MLNSRNAIIAAALFAIVSMVVGVASLMQPPDSGGQGLDSYGVRQYGHQALFETLERLQVPVERNLIPPANLPAGKLTLVFLAPDADLVRQEPAYLDEASRWIKAGGHAVATPTQDSASSSRRSSGSRDSFPTSSTRCLALLGAKGIVVKDSAKSSSIEISATESSSGNDDNDNESDSPANWPAQSMGWLRDKPIATITVDAHCEGSLAALQDQVRRLVLPAESTMLISEEGTSPTGRVRVVLPDGREGTLAAVYASGDGTITALSDPRIAANGLAAKEDNPVLLVKLIAGEGRRAVFDEFYHGLTVRGNPAWLLTRFPFGLMAALIGAFAGLWMWRGAIRLGPPLDPAGEGRRSLQDYLEAMASLFGGARSRAYLLSELLHGGLWSLRQKLGLPHGRDSIGDLARAASRRDPEAGAEFEEAAEALERAAADAQISRAGSLAAARRFQASLQRIP